VPRIILQLQLMLIFKEWMLSLRIPNGCIVETRCGQDRPFVVVVE